MHGVIRTFRMYPFGESFASAVHRTNITTSKTESNILYNLFELQVILQNGSIVKKTKIWQAANLVKDSYYRLLVPHSLLMW